MVSIRIPRAEAWVTHPNIPDLSVLLEEPTRAEMGQRSYDLQRHRGAPVAILHPTTGEPIRDPVTGKIETQMPALAADPDEVKEFLGKTMKKVEGIDEENAPMPEILSAFEERAFDTTEDGQKKSFAVYLFLKLFDDSTFERVDPLAKTSASRPNSN